MGEIAHAHQRRFWLVLAGRGGRGFKYTVPKSIMAKLDEIDKTVPDQQ